MSVVIVTRKVIGSIHVLTRVSQRFRKDFPDHLLHLGHHNSIHNKVPNNILVLLTALAAPTSSEEYSSTLDITDISLPTTSPKVPDCPSPPATFSLSSLIPPAPLVYSRHHAASTILSSSFMAPPSDFGDLDLPARRYLTHSRHPLTRWEELAQYEPLSDFPSNGAVESKCLDRRHTYQFLMGLKSEFETLRTQILNTSSLPSLYEAFATMDVVFLAPWWWSWEWLQWRPRSRHSSTSAFAEVDPIPTDLPDFKQLQLQIAQLQSHLGLAPASSSSGPTAAIVAETPTALHGPDFEEDFCRGISEMDYTTLGILYHLVRYRLAFMFSLHQF
ncbi:hypothetical protein Acr_04g0002710 [Actinidia rufa]|uniref:Uncharacterized protein n=1 Tax=Actinidia rufa TaxID=165716 RepID=A0A7J0EGE1_9ERIC|nr:hypothetical protein Acr_04g0002710 [Actinidia rufa]